MTTTTQPVPAAKTRMPASVRGAQALFLLPLGLLQLTATIVFTVKDGLHGTGDYVIGVWAPVMALACVAFALTMSRPRPATLRIGLLLLTAQAAFSVTKLIGYHETASFTFLAVVAAAAGLLVLPRSRQHLLG